jgi:hypothetical protein
MSMDKKIKTIDLTPTWPEAFTMLLAVMEDGTYEGKQAAREQLMKAAEFAQVSAELFQAAKARINGEWDNKHLEKFGALSVNEDEDLLRIFKNALERV